MSETGKLPELGRVTLVSRGWPGGLGRGGRGCRFFTERSYVSLTTLVTSQPHRISAPQCARMVKLGVQTVVFNRLDSQSTGLEQPK